MSPRTAAARSPRGSPPPSPGRAEPPVPSPQLARRGLRLGPERGWLSLEAVMILPVLALLILGVLQVGAVIRDLLVVHDAARAGLRAATTSSGDRTVLVAVAQATPELDAAATVEPPRRTDGDIVTVTVTAERHIGPVRHRLRATAVGRVEPAVGAEPDGGWSRRHATPP